MAENSRRKRLAGLFRAALILLCLCVAPRCAVAGLSSLLSGSAPELTTQADLIVRGRVVDVDLSQPKRLIVHIKADAVLKGNWKRDMLTLSLPGLESMELVDGLPKNQYALFFLLQNGERIAPCDQSHIKIPIREGRLTAPDESQDPLERVREELLFTASASLLKPELKPQVPAPHWEVPLDVGAVQQLGLLPVEPRTVALLKSLLPAEDRRLKRVAIISLLRLKQPEAVQAAFGYIDSYPQPEAPSTVASWEESEMFSTMAGAVASARNVDPKAVDPKAINTLGKMLKHKNVGLHSPAIQALRGIYGYSINPGHPLKKLTDARTIPYLVQALDDEDATVRFYAVAALAEVTQSLRWYPPYHPPAFTGPEIRYAAPGEEQKFIDHWKQWWTTTGKPAFDAEAQQPASK